MISYLQGRVLSLNDHTLTVLCSSGIGYDVELSLSLAHQCSDKNEIALFTHLQINADSQRLYGFETTEQRALFRLLLKVSGVGPKVAMAILALGRVDEIVDAMYREDIAFLTQAKGLGKRGAEKINLEVRDRLRSLSPFQEGAPKPENQSSQPFEEARLALLALGYRPKEAQMRLEYANNQSPQSSVAELIRIALQASLS